MSSEIKVDLIKDKSGTKTLATLSSSAVTLGSDVIAISAFTLSDAHSGSVASREFTGIPSWHRHIYLFFNQVSFADTSNLMMQLGYGGTPTYQTSGYITSQTNALSAQATATDSFTIVVGDAGRSFTGMSIFTRMNDTTYYWQCHMGGHSNLPTYAFGQVILSSGPATAIKSKGSNGGNHDAGTMYAGWE